MSFKSKKLLTVSTSLQITSKKYLMHMSTHFNHKPSTLNHMNDVGVVFLNVNNDASLVVGGESYHAVKEGSCVMVGHFAI
jgi:hypothetical protein